MEIVGGRLAGRQILITGATSGIGRSTATLFAREGASLLLRDRDATLPDVPTAAEHGSPGLTVTASNGFVLPHATPDPVVARLPALAGETQAEPSVRRRFDHLGLELLPTDTPHFERLWQADREIWQPLIRSLDMTADG